MRFHPIKLAKVRSTAITANADAMAIKIVLSSRFIVSVFMRRIVYIRCCGAIKDDDTRKPYQQRYLLRPTQSRG